MHLDAAHPGRPLPGSTSTSSSLRIRPAINVPETTVPKPFIVKQRSTGRRKICDASRGATSSASRRSSAVSALDAFAGDRADAEERRVLQERALQDHSRTSISARSARSPFGGVDLRQHRQAALDAQQRADVEMLACLRHHRLVCGDDQHHGVDAADAAEHVLDEPLMARHVDEANRRLVVQCAGWQSRCRW